MDLEYAKQQERERLAFVEKRDGLAGAISFAKRTLLIYRTNVLHSRKRKVAFPSHASIPEYRGLFIASIVVLRDFLNKRGVKC